MAKLPPSFRTIVDGRDLVESLRDSFGTKSGWIMANGFVEHVEMKLPTDGADTRRLFRGRYALAQLTGPLGGPYGATLSRVESGNLEVICGIMVAARSAGVHALCLSADGEIAVARGPAEAPELSPESAAASNNPGAPPRNQPSSSAEREPAAPAASGWAARVSAVAAAQAEPEEEVEAGEPERGDLIQHFAFGLCEVLTASDDKLMIRDLSGPGRIREIRINMLNVERPTERDGKRLFRLTRKS